MVVAVHESRENLYPVKEWSLTLQLACEKRSHVLHWLVPRTTVDTGMTIFGATRRYLKVEYDNRSRKVNLCDRVWH